MAIAAVIPITRCLYEVPHPAAQLQIHYKEGNAMNENNRVLSRQNARELTPAEVDHVTGKSTL